MNRKTAVRKFLLFSHMALIHLVLMNKRYSKASTIEFDELESHEHTKCKPLSVPLAVESKTRRILGFRVCSMPAKGRLAKISVKRYGRRKDERRKARSELLKELRGIVKEDALIKTDKNPHYAAEIKKFFESATHFTTKGRRGATTGQGELKVGGFDPLFSLNHTCAMLRENINRLRRKTWCTTKLASRLNLHIALYAVYHNMALERGA